METVNDRIKKIRIMLGLAQNEFAKQIFISKSYYGDIELGNQAANDRIIHLVSVQFNINKEWLKTGEGEIFNGAPPDLKLGRLIEIYNSLDEQLQEYLLQQSDLLLKIQKEKNKIND
jgi:transcriptional regulator with XRE-family HTH domain